MYKHRKESERFYLAAIAVVQSSLNPEDKIQVVETLLDRKRLAEFTEAREAEELLKVEEENEKLF